MTYTRLNNEYSIPILRILKGDNITEFNPKKEDIRKAFNIRITYTNNIEFPNLYTIERNYYIKSIHSFVFEPNTADIIHNIFHPKNNRYNNLLSTQTIRNNNTIRYIWEVEYDIATMIEDYFEQRIYEADIFVISNWRIVKWFKSLFNR